MHRTLLYWLLAVFLLASGGAYRFRLIRNPDFEQGFDEKIYVMYVERLAERGVGEYPSLIREYPAEVSQAPTSYLPPTRAGFILPAWALTKLTPWKPYEALRLVSAAASWLFSLVGFLFARRWVTARMALAVLGLLTCAPLQIHLSQFAFIDGVAALWALVAVASAWECFRQPQRTGWAVVTGLGAFALLMTKQETAVFVATFFLCALLLGKWLKLTSNPWPCAAGLGGAALAGAAALLLLAGGRLSDLVADFRTFVILNQTLPYNLVTGDGPWQRYLLEYVLIEPLVILSALAAIFRGQPADGTGKYWVLYIVTTYAVMCNIPLSMNIRHTVMWDFPFALLAVAGLSSLTSRLRYPTWWAAAVTGLICITSLLQYTRIFHELYDTDPRFMLRAVRMIQF